MSLDPADLLDEDGNVDAGAVRARQNRGKDNDPDVDTETCAQWRRDAAGAPNARAVADEHNRAEDTVRRHISGQCSCSHGVPALVFDRQYGEMGVGSSGKWRVADE